MKNPQKANKVAGPDAKVLPVGEIKEALEKILPPTTPVARVADNGHLNSGFPLLNGSDHPALAEKAEAFNVLDLPSLTDLRMRAVERAHDMISLHAMRLVESKSDTLSVVIKPAIGTELSLELRQHRNEVEARATVTRGDAQFLGQHWAELQQRLEQRGIKLAALAAGADFSPNGHGDFQRQHASAEEIAQHASAFAEFAAIENNGGATARLSAYDGWESWA